MPYGLYKPEDAKDTKGFKYLPDRKYENACLRDFGQGCAVIHGRPIFDKPDVDEDKLEDRYCHDWFQVTWQVEDCYGREPTGSNGKSYIKANSFADAKVKAEIELPKRTSNKFLGVYSIDWVRKDKINKMLIM